MRSAWFFTSVITVLAVVCLASTSTVRGGPHRGQTAPVSDPPLAFTENQGQWNERVLFRADVGWSTTVPQMPSSQS